MTRPRLSVAAASLIRALRRRASLPEDRIFLTHCVSTDWRSLTFAGERHQLGLRVAGPDAAAVAAALTDGIEEADLPLGRGFVADITLSAPPASQPDGSIFIELEALTLDD